VLCLKSGSNTRPCHYE